MEILEFAFNGHTFHGKDMHILLVEFQTVWPYVLTLIHIAGACWVTVDAISRKDDVRAAVGWIGLAWLSPILGTTAYTLLGINRIRRKGASLGLLLAWNHEADVRMTREDVSRIQELQKSHPTFMGLARLGRMVTGNDIMLGNAITPLLNGDAAYPEMLHAINQAKVSVNLNSYIFDSDPIGEKFLTALKSAQERGVEIRVLIDGVGARYSKPSMVELLTKEGIRAAAFLPPYRVPWRLPYANLRNHRKILVVDGKIGFTGGTNIRIGHCLKCNPKFPVACLHFRLEGPIVAELQEMFAIDWAFTSGESLVGSTWFPILERRGNIVARGIPDGPDEDLNKISEIILGALSVAETQVRITTPYFLPDASILDALTIASMRGVKVDILIPEKNNIGIMNWAVIPQLPKLIEKGCRIYMVPPPFDHTKLFVVDGLWSLIGSTNWDPRSLRLNFEYNVECYDKNLAEHLNCIIDSKIKRSRQLTLEELNKRPRLVRLRDGAARLLSPYL